VVENPIINQVVFEGNHNLKDDKLRDEVQVRPRGIFTRAKVQADVQRIVELYRRSGRISVTVTPQIVELPQKRVDLIFEITKGPRAASSDQFPRQQAVLRQRPARRRSPPRKAAGTGSSVQRQLRPRPDRLRSGAAAQVLSQPRLLRFPHRRCGRRAGAGQERLRVTYTLDEGAKYKFGKLTVNTDLKKLNPRCCAAAADPRRASSTRTTRSTRPPTP
jgi:outer membrane protein insertion porin family